MRGHDAVQLGSQPGKNATAVTGTYGLLAALIHRQREIAESARPNRGQENALRRSLPAACQAGNIGPTQSVLPSVGISAHGERSPITWSAVVIQIQHGAQS